VEIISEWKSIWGPIWRITISGYEFIYRRLTISEHRVMHSASLNDCEFEDAVVREALLYPEDLGDLPAMIPTVLAGHILDASMLGADSDSWSVYLNSRKDSLTSRRVDGSRELVIDDPIIPLVVQICQVFPAYKPDELLKLPVSDLLDRLAWAELAMGNLKERKEPSSVPPGLSGGERQQYLEGASADASKAALEEEMRRAKPKIRRV